MSNAAQPALAAPTAREIANRENARHSTGPITPEGKAAVRANALKHGLYSQTALLPTEDRAEFDAALENLLRQFSPVGDSEGSLIRGLHECEWRLARMRRTEVYLVALTMREQAPAFENETDPDLRDGLTQAAAFRANARLLDQLRRHENHFLREHATLLARFEALKLARQYVEFSAQRAQRAAASSGAPQSAETKPTADPPTPTFTGPMRNIKRKQWLRAHGQR